MGIGKPKKSAAIVKKSARSVASPKWGVPATPTEADATAIVALTTLVGIPLPPTIAFNLLSAISSLVSGGVEHVDEWVRGRTEEMRANRSNKLRRESAETDAHIRGVEAQAAVEEVVLKGMGKPALRQLSGDPDAVKRAARVFGRRLLGNQRNLDAITVEAFEVMRNDPPTADGDAPVDADWLDTFRRLPETKSAADARTYFARVLAGEVRRPKSFAPSTLEVLAHLAPADASLFKLLCSVSCTLPADDSQRPLVLTGPYGAVGGNSMKSIGLSLREMFQLADARLLRPVFGGNVEVSMGDWIGSNQPLVLAGRKMWLRSIHGHEHEKFHAHTYPIEAVWFTRAGEELRTIADLAPHPHYVATVTKWLERRGIAVTDATPSTGAPG